jgi:purine-nucleoside phosphorylase
MKNLPRSATEKALISAEKLVSSKDMGLGPYQVTKAILAFISVGRMSEKFCEKGGKQLPISQYWNTWVREDGTILAGPIFGGPMCAVVMEELAAIGVKYFIGYGYSGTLDHEVPTCSIMAADAALCSDGTSKEYSTRREVSADDEMLQRMLDLIQKRGITSTTGKVWTTDGIYREFPSKVAYWKKKGARFVNMDTGPLYAVAREKGLKAAYLSVVSDDVSGDEWSGWFGDFKQVMGQVWDICLDMAETL